MWKRLLEAGGGIGRLKRVFGDKNGAVEPGNLPVKAGELPG